MHPKARVNGPSQAKKANITLRAQMQSGWKGQDAAQVSEWERAATTWHPLGQTATTANEANGQANAHCCDEDRWLLQEMTTSKASHRTPSFDPVLSTAAAAESAQLRGLATASVAIVEGT
ncbi:hypothetical protein E4U40_006854 [Claviceps sp. LM458 group G5]|nr:hypothetical protein E4U40_006854 [Claviceps sp. LM458 group G5]KAG6052344.1 hypothetical protein E4U39_000069 [Claviceps sp. Clav50 group G5]